MTQEQVLVLCLNVRLHLLLQKPEMYCHNDQIWNGISENKAGLQHEFDIATIVQPLLSQTLISRFTSKHEVKLITVGILFQFIGIQIQPFNPKFLII